MDKIKSMEIECWSKRREQICSGVYDYVRGFVETSDLMRRGWRRAGCWRTRTRRNWNSGTSLRNSRGLEGPGEGRAGGVVSRGSSRSRATCKRKRLNQFRVIVSVY